MQVKMQPTSVIIAKLGLNYNGKVHKFFQNACYKAMDKYVPMDEGNLRTIVDLSNPSYIIYEVPYARYQYYGMRDDGTRKVVNYTTPGTGPYWDKKMWNVEGKRIVNEVQEYVNRGG